MTLPSQTTLRNLLDYNPETGELFWKERSLELFRREQDWKTWNTKFAGKSAFTSRTKKGYQQGRIWNQNLLAHRVIWIWMTGEEPDQIDHINGVRSDNRWRNLRSVSTAENQKNTCRPHNNTSGVVGVHWSADRQKWQAQIRVEGSTKPLGRFDTFEEAAATRKAAEQQYGFHENHGRIQ